jgi:hypothetical protein
MRFKVTGRRTLSVDQVAVAEVEADDEDDAVRAFLDETLEWKDDEDGDAVAEHYDFDTEIVKA